MVGEEIYQRNRTLRGVTNEIVDIIWKRSEIGKDYGVILIPEGIIEFFPEVKPLLSEINEMFGENNNIEDPRKYVLSKLTEKSKDLFEFLPKAISDQLLLDRDPHGNVQVAKIETEILMILLCQKELEERAAKGEYKGSFSPQSHYFGYEGRCALPSNFDAQYCYSIGRTSASLIQLGLSGYMAINRKVDEQDPEKWIAAGCPLPTMMGLERRKGKNVPVITKYVVELDGPMFKAYEQFKDRWALYDWYLSPGPIQLHDPSAIDVPFIVKLPDLEVIERETQERIEIDKKRDKANQYFAIGECNLSKASKELSNIIVPIPTTLEEGNYAWVAIRKAKALNIDIEETLHEQYPLLWNDAFATHFVEIVDKKVERIAHEFDDEEGVKLLNKCFAKKNLKQLKIGIVIWGRQAPGMHNIIDGLLRFADNHGFVQLIGFINGTTGFYKGDHIIITKENFKLFRNQGGWDFLGRSADEIKSDEQQKQAKTTWKKLSLDGLVLVGATHTMTDAAHLTDYFLKEKISTRVISIPATIYGNINHGYVEATVGFDSASKLYSQLIGNMMTDAASAVKYWYFMRLMGGDPSHLAVESSLQTGPNWVVVSEQCAKDSETLPALVCRIWDLITARYEEGKAFGTIIVPDGLLSHLSHYHLLIQELNNAFSSCKTYEEIEDLEHKLTQPDALSSKILSPWSLAVYQTLPDFIKKQLSISRKMSKKFDIYAIQTEKLLSYLVDEELKKRKKEGKGKVPFSPVTHFFGYQGRGSTPSLFDASLASTYGFTAGVLVQNGLTGLCVTARGLASDPTDWKIGGVPLVAMMKKKNKSSVYGKDQVMIRSEEVDLEGGAYQKIKVSSKRWEINDRYMNPGPMQLFGENSHRVNDTVFHGNLKYSSQVTMIKDLCNLIQRRLTFADDTGVPSKIYPGLSGVIRGKS